MTTYKAFRHFSPERQAEKLAAISEMEVYLVLQGASYDLGLLLAGGQNHLRDNIRQGFMSRMRCYEEKIYPTGETFGEYNTRSPSQCRWTLDAIIDSEETFKIKVG